MTHLIRTLLIGLVVALVAAACGSDQPAATVNGEAITMDQVVGMVTTAENATTANAEEIRDVLSGLVIETTLVQAAEEQYDIVVTEAEIDARIANPPPRYAGVFADLAAAGATEASLRSQALRSLLRDAVAPRIIADEGPLAEFVEENRPFATRVCAQIMVALDEDVAIAAAERLRADESFETVATEILEQSPDRVGVLDNSTSCPQFVSTLDQSLFDVALTATEGEWVGPIAVSSGFVLIKVTDREDPPEDPEDVMDYVDSRLVSDYFTSWFNDAVRVAVIEIDPTIGSWSVAGIGIIAPE